MNMSSSTRLRAAAPRSTRLLLAGLLFPAVLLLLPACGERSELPPEYQNLTEQERAAAVVRARTQGLVHLERDRLDEAETEFRLLAALAPDDAAGPANLALVALRRGDVDAAERWSREALERAPEDPSVHLVRARVLEVAGDGEAARTELDRVLELDPGNVRALWALAGGSSEEGTGAGEDAGAPTVPADSAAPTVPADSAAPTVPADSARVALLARVVEEAPANLAARLELVEALLSRDETDDAAPHLEEVRAIVPRFPDGGEAAFDRALAGARAGDADAARAPARELHDRVRLTSAYQSALDDLRGPPGEATGFPTLSFSHELSLQVPDSAAVLAALRFVDATEFAGLGGDPSVAESVVATGDFDGDGDQDLYAWSPVGPPEGRHRLLRNDLGRFVEQTPDALTGPATVRAARFADYDGDGLVDLYLVRDGPDALYRNRGDGRFEEVGEEAGVADDGTAPSAADRTGAPTAVPTTAAAALFADLDHDADLDLWVAEAGSVRLHRNRGDGGFSPVAGAMGLVDYAGGAAFTDAAFADFDDDGDLDVVATRAGDSSGPQARSLWFENLRQDRFRPRPAAEGRADLPQARAVAVADYDNDGYGDLAFATVDGPVALYRNPGDGEFEPDRRSDDVLAAAGPARALTFLDFDNDGRLDLALAGADGVVLLRNRGDGAFEDRSDLLPADRPAATGVTAFDYNEDGDQDLLLTTAAGPRLLRNDGGNANHHFELRLVARGPGSGKVNRFGIGSKVEVRAGDLYQTRTVRGPVTHFGLGSRLKADVVRIVWTNGVPQYLHFPGTQEELLESQELKGSCAFVYAWDGERYTFITDAMWRSAIGMPLGILGADGGDASERGSARGSERIYAPAGASKEFLRIPGDRLRPRDGRYRLQLTEELWEVAYVDDVKLLAVDHPDSVEIFVDEKFVPPAPPRLQLFTVGERLLPVSAVDGAGQDLLPALRSQDARYVADLSVGAYQGVVAPHDVVLELPPGAARAERPFLFLQGWIFPTDASINVATSQTDGVSVAPPRLDVPDGRGGWRTAIPQMGFPAGKDKTVVVDLTGVVRRDDPRVRIRTNIQVYWDHAFFAVGDVAGLPVDGGAAAAAVEADRRPATTRVHLLEPVAADLHHRGFSREYRKGGRHGPHWFDYDDVSAESRWIPIPGRYTRFGDVLPLLEGPDDMYVVMAPGDETTVEFDAAGAPAVPDGWTRTFLLYTDGWIKDADLNTARGGTVEPYPFQTQSHYPHGPGEAYPSDAEHRAYLERYQTREVRGGTLGLKR